MPTWRQVVWCTASNVAAVTGDAERALACTSEAESFDTAGLASAQNALARALALLQLGRMREAEETAEAVFGLDLDPGERSYANAIATLTRAAAGRLEDAVAAAESLGPQDGSYLDRVRAHMGRGLAYAQLGRRFACRGAFDAALEIVDGTSDQLHQALVRLARGLAFESLGMPESGEGVTGAREKLRRLGVVHDGWDVALRLCVGSAEHAAG
jgi:tetratricopeptide (TPR) repeat protein